MTNPSYNDNQLETSELRHLFIPNRFAVVFETVIAAVLLMLLNLGAIGDALGGHSSGIDTSPLSLWSQVVDRLLSGWSAGSFIQRALLFALWAIVGALVYMLLFRVFQVSVRARNSVRQGNLLVRTEGQQGLVRYLASLHDFFMRSLVIATGVTALVIGALLCFSIASQQLGIGLDTSFPANLGHFTIAYIGALLAVRTVTIGVSLLSVRFRAWYNL